MKKVAQISCLVFIMLSMTIVAQAQQFGYVNSQRILAEMPEVKEMDSNLEVLQKQYQKRGQTKVQSLQQDYVAIQEKVQKGLLSPKQQEEEGKKLEDRQKEIAKMEQEMVTEIQNKRQELLEPILKKVNDAINTVAKEKGMTMVFDQGVLLYADETMDIYKDVKARL